MGKPSTEVREIKTVQLRRTPLTERAIAAEALGIGRGSILNVEKESERCWTVTYLAEQKHLDNL